MRKATKVKGGYSDGWKDESEAHRIKPTGWATFGKHRWLDDPKLKKNTHIYYIYIYTYIHEHKLYICVWKCTCSWKTAMPICNVRLQYCKHWRNLKCIVIESRPNFADLDHRTILSNPTSTTPHMSGLYWKFWGVQHFSSPSFQQCIAGSSVRLFFWRKHTKNA